MLRRLSRVTPLLLLPTLALSGGTAAASPSVARGDGPTAVHNGAYAGAETSIWAVSSNGRTVVVMLVAGLPDQAVGSTLGAHVHVGACGSDPLASGGHYMNPDGDPSDPLAEREIWLDFTVHAGGYGFAVAHADWEITAGDANSVVIHANATDPGTGGAGSRLLCTDVPFGV